MKRPRPQPPTDAPEETIWFGGPIGWFSISLNIRADGLVPEDVTRLFLVEPTRTRAKGRPISERPGAPISSFGLWAVELTPQETDEWDVAEAIRLLFSRLPEAPSIWRQLPADVHIGLNLGLHLETANQGFSLPADILQSAADRNVEIKFDIYDRTMP